VKCGEGKTNLPEMSLLKFLLSTYHHSHFLAATLNFTSFFHNGLLGGHALFFTAGLFWIRLVIIDEWLIAGPNSSMPQ